jgi:selenocysteine lyase/cysteine desulfurase
MDADNQHLLRAQKLLSEFRNGLTGENRLGRMAHDLVGKDAELDGPFGRKKMLYADYVASGRALMSVERFILENVLPFYANSHTEASYCGGFMTGLRQAARRVIAEHCGADKDHAVIFAGAGATAGLNRLVTLLGVASDTAGARPLVILGPYEHHSNILPWRESPAEIIEIGESDHGGPDLVQLDAALASARGRPTVCAFSIASNVTGIVSDVVEITRLANQAQAKIVWDYAGGGPYLPITMMPAPGVNIDAIVISPHKFIGGPGASGVLVVRRDAVVTRRPTWPGGGTVKFVSPTAHDYSNNLEAREEAGTPNILGDIRAALAFLVKDAIGQDTMRVRNADVSARAFAAWKDVANLELLGHSSAMRLPIFSFRVADGRGGLVHQQLVTRMLSDRYGIQARGGCACAGPYVHRLLDLDDSESEAIRSDIASGNELRKPGFSRLNFSVLLSDEKVDYILNAVRELAHNAASHSDVYDVDADRAIFYPRKQDHLCADVA